jgi:hypothetical protein
MTLVLSVLLSLATIYGLNRMVRSMKFHRRRAAFVIRRRIKAILCETSLTVCLRRRNYLLLAHSTQFHTVLETYLRPNSASKGAQPKP